MVAREVRVLGRGDVDADRACKLAVEIKPEDAPVWRVIIRVGESLGGTRRDRAFGQVQLVTKPENGLAFLGCVGGPAVEPIEQLGYAIRTELLKIYPLPSVSRDYACSVGRCGVPRRTTIRTRVPSTVLLVNLG